jgi:hypothetical protein
MKKGQLFDFLQRKREEVEPEKDDVDTAVDVGDEGLEESVEEVPDSCAQRPRAATRQPKRRKLTSSEDDDDDASRAQPVVAVDVVTSVAVLRASMQAGNITFPSRSF